jgi:hypothetical protein
MAMNQKLDEHMYPWSRIESYQTTIQVDDQNSDTIMDVIYAYHHTKSIKLLLSRFFT